MPLQNRVAPDASIWARPERGLVMGNRGRRIHDPVTKTLRTPRWSSRAWICCTLAFKGRHHDVFGRTYTALFFCDEVTALAAGHRPCMECRRRDALAFRAAVVAGRGLTETPSFPDLDRLLDAERRDGRDKRLHEVAFDDLPDGAMVSEGPERFAAIRGTALLPWSFAGYGAPRPRPRGKAQVLTPPTTLAALASGYSPTWHPGAVTPSGG